MTPPCPNCGTIYSEGPPDDAGWRTTSIYATTIWDSGDTRRPAFFGVEYVCCKCAHTWRVPMEPAAAGDGGETE